MINEEKNLNDLKYIYPAAYAALSYIYPMDKSLRCKMVNYNPEVKPVIYAIWHGWQYGLLSIKGEQRKNLNLLVSKSNDGEIIARVSNTLGFSLVRGSHKRGGTQALRDMIKTLRKGQNIAYTVDGPKGPIYKVKEGIIRIAQMSGSPIIPLVPDCNAKITVNSWDKYKVPYFFAKVVSVFGDAMYIPKDADDTAVENYRQELENRMFELQDIAKRELKGSKLFHL